MGANNIEKMIEDIFEFVDNARSPMGNPNKVILHRGELYDMLDALRLRTPEEIKRYQKVIANRDRIIDDANKSAALVVEQANSRAAALIDESEMVRQANQRAQEIITAATQEANRIITNANEEAAQYRINAITYTNSLLTNAESAIQAAYKESAVRYDELFNTMKMNLETIRENKRELEMSLPYEVQKENQEAEDLAGEEIASLLEEVDE